MIETGLRKLFTLPKTTKKKKDNSEKIKSDDRNIDTSYHRRWLLQCAQQGEITTIQEMIDKDVTPNYQDREGRSALQIAVENSNIELLKILSKSKTLTPNPVLKENGVTPLLSACRFLKNQPDRLNIVKILLKIPEIDVNAQDKSGYTSICYAALYGDFQLVQLLVESKADLNLGPDKDGKIHGALYYAKQSRVAELISFIEAKGAIEFPVSSQVKKALPVPRVSRVHSRPVKPNFLPSPTLPTSPSADARKRAGSRPKSESSESHESFRIPPLIRTTSKSHYTYNKPVIEVDEETEELRRNLLESLHEENVKKLTQLILTGADPNFTEESGLTPLLIAIDKCNPELVRVLLKSPSINVNYPDEITGIYPIIAAARNLFKGPARLEIMKLLLSAKDIELNSQDNDGLTALIFASIVGDIEIAQLLISAGVDINLGNEGGNIIHTPLSYAKKHDHATLVQLLELNGGVDGEPIGTTGESQNTDDSVPATAVPINVTPIPKMTITDDPKGDTKWNRSLLLLKVRSAETSAVQKLLEKGVDPNFVDEEGVTALLAAIEKRSNSLIKVLLASPKINVNLRDETTGETPLIFAAKLQGNKTELVKVLLQGEGILINSQDNDGRTALLIAVESGDIELVKLLIECGVDVKIPKKNPNGTLETPLDIARKSDNAEIITLLQNVIPPMKVSHPSSVLSPPSVLAPPSPKPVKEEPSKADTKFNRSKLLIDVRKGDTKSVRNLLEQGVNPNYIDDEGDTPLIVAITKKEQNIIKLLCSNSKIDPNLYDTEFGEAPLVITLKVHSGNDRLEIVKLLLGTPGINILITDLQGSTASAIAQQFGDAELTKLFTDFVPPKKSAESRPDSPLRNLTSRNTPPKNSHPVKITTSTTSSPATKSKPANTGPEIRPPEIKPSEQPKPDAPPKSEDTKWNRSLLLINAKKTDNKALKKLLEKGVSPNFVDEEGESPLSVTISKGNLEGVKALLNLESTKIDINLADEMSGITPLMYAAQNKSSHRLEIIKLILQKEGVTINAQDEEGRTALVIAAQSGDIEIAKILVEAGADINIGRSTNETPLHYAKVLNNKDLISLFQAKGPKEEAPKPFVPTRERLLTKTLVELRSTMSSQNTAPKTLSSYTPNPNQPPTNRLKSLNFSEKIFVRVPVRDPISDIITGRDWKRFIFETNEDTTALVCKDVNTNLEVPEYRITFSKVKRVEKRDMCNEPNKFVFVINPLKIQLAAFTEKGREIWMEIIMQFYKESQKNAVKHELIEGPKSAGRPRFAPVVAEDTDENRNLLYQKVTSGDVKAIIQLLVKRVNPNSLISGKTCLISAIEASNIQVIETLLTSPLIDVNMSDERGLTPLHHALKRPEKFPICQLILGNSSININLPDKNERAPLVYSVLTGDIELCKMLLDSKADINQGKKVGDKKETPLYIAITKNFQKLVPFLLANGAENVEIKNESNEPPPVSDNLVNNNESPQMKITPQKTPATHLVSEARMIYPITNDPRQQEILKLMKEENTFASVIDLLKQHVDINFYDDQGKTPLIIAIDRSDRNFVRIFLKGPNVNVNMPDASGCSPLIKSIISNKGPERIRIIVHIIEKDGINLNLPDKEQRLTPLIHAILLGDLEVVKILVKAGADVNLGKKTRERVETPLYYAKTSNNIPIISFLEVNGAFEISLLDEKSTTNNSTDYNKKLLLLSCQKSELTTVADLIKKGVDPNYIDHTGQLPLQIAIDNQNIILLRLLLKSPLIDPNIRFSTVQCTPLIFACKQKQNTRLEMVKLLIQSGSKIDVNALDKNFRSALTYACFYGDYDLVKTLLDANASVNPQLINPISISPLVFAKRYNHAKVVALLLQHGALDVDSTLTAHASLKHSPTLSSSAGANEDSGHLSTSLTTPRTPRPKQPQQKVPSLAYSYTMTENRPGGSPQEERPQPHKRNVSHTLGLKMVIDED